MAEGTIKIHCAGIWACLCTYHADELTKITVVFNQLIVCEKRVSWTMLHGAGVKQTKLCASLLNLKLVFFDLLTGVMPVLVVTQPINALAFVWDGALFGCGGFRCACAQHQSVEMECGPHTLTFDDSFPHPAAVCSLLYTNVVICQHPVICKVIILIIVLFNPTSASPTASAHKSSSHIHCLNHACLTSVQPFVSLSKELRALICTNCPLLAAVPALFAPRQQVCICGHGRLCRARAWRNLVRRPSGQPS